MTPDHPVRRVLARVCSAETMARLVDPTLGDIAFERGRPAWLGYVALVRALALHALQSAPSGLVRAWNDDGPAVTRAVAVSAVTALLLTAPLVGFPLSTQQWRSPWWPLVLLIPQAMALALPVSLVIAIPFAFRDTAAVRRLITRVAALSLVCAAATFVVIVRIMPEANQAFRVEASRQIGNEISDLDRGPNEMSPRQLRERIDIVRLAPDGVRLARELEYTYQLKFALSAIPIPLGALGLAIALSARGRIRAVLTGTACVLAYIFGVFPLDAWSRQLLERSDAVSPAVLAWMPTVLISMMLAVFAVKRQRPLGRVWV